MFKIGDKVVCVNDEHDVHNEIKIGGIYEIEEIDKGMINLKGHQIRNWFEYRFKIYRREPLTYEKALAILAKGESKCQQ